MLVENTLEEGTVYAFKLVSGEELMAKVVTASLSEVKLHKPMSVVQAGQGLGLVATFALAADADITLKIDKVVAHYKPLSEYETSYIEASTGISVQNQGIIT